MRERKEGGFNGSGCAKKFRGIEEQKWTREYITERNSILNQRKKFWGVIIKEEIGIKLLKITIKMELSVFECFLHVTSHNSYLYYLNYEMQDIGLVKLMDICVHQKHTVIGNVYCLEVDEAYMKIIEIDD